MKMKKYWFKPARFWKYFAFYYPVTFWGWFVTMFCFVSIVKIFWAFDKMTHSVSDTLIVFIPWALGFMILFDIFCRVFGEFSYWWRRKS